MASRSTRTPSADRDMASPLGKRCRSTRHTSCDIPLVPDSERPPKRSKVDEELERMLVASPISYSEPSVDHLPSLHHEHGVVHDDTYYMPDGSCVLRVENTLFNVSFPVIILGDRANKSALPRSTERA